MHSFAVVSVVIFVACVLDFTQCTQDKREVLVKAMEELQKRKIQEEMMELLNDQVVGSTCVNILVQRDIKLASGWKYTYAECLDDDCRDRGKENTVKVSNWRENMFGYYPIFGLKPSTTYKITVEYQARKGEDTNSINSKDLRDSIRVTTAAKGTYVAFCEKGCASNPCASGETCIGSKDGHDCVSESGSASKRELLKLLAKLLKD